MMCRFVDTLFLTSHIIITFYHTLKQTMVELHRSSRALFDMIYELTARPTLVESQQQSTLSFALLIAVIESYTKL